MTLQTFISVGLVSLLVIGNTFVSITKGNEWDAQQQASQVIREVFDVEELDHHPDVKEYIKKNGYEKYLKSDHQTFADVSRVYDLTALERPEPSNGIDSETEQRLIEAYGLEKPEPELLLFEQKIIVRRNSTTNAIEGVSAFNHMVSHYGATIMLVHFQPGADPVVEILDTTQR